MERAMLEAVVVNEVGRPADIRRYLDCTLLNATNPPAQVSNLTLHSAHAPAQRHQLACSAALHSALPGAQRTKEACTLF
jgi:hypothetical protein